MTDNKITWQAIAEDFRKHHPSLSKDMTYWVPCGIATIEIHIIGGMILEYNYDLHKAIVKQEEREE